MERTGTVINWPPPLITVLLLQSSVNLKSFPVFQSFQPGKNFLFLHIGNFIFQKKVLEKMEIWKNAHGIRVLRVFRRWKALEGDGKSVNCSNCQ